MTDRVKSYVGVALSALAGGVITYRMYPLIHERIASPGSELYSTALFLFITIMLSVAVFREEHDG